MWVCCWKILNEFCVNVTIYDFEVDIYFKNFYLLIQTFGNLLPAFTFGPVIENEKMPGAFLVDEVSKLLARQSNVPWITGINSHEGGMMALRMFTKYSVH